MYHSKASHFNGFKHRSDFSASRSERNLRVLEIDKGFLEFALREQTPSRQHGGWIGKCPYCDAADKTKNKQAYLTPRETGFVFHCCSCGVSQTVFKFLLNAYGDQKAQGYAQARWDAGELCGGGWNCPLPQKVRENRQKEKEERKAAFKAAYANEREVNRLNKYNM